MERIFPFFFIPGLLGMYFRQQGNLMTPQSEAFGIKPENHTIVQ